MLSPVIKRMCRKKRRLYNKAKMGSTKHRSLYKTLKNTTRDALRKSHWDYVNGMLQEEEAESGGFKRFWRYCKAQNQDSQGVAPIIRDDCKLLPDAESNSKALSKKFCSVFTKDTP